MAALGHVDGKLKLHVAAIKQGALTVSDLRLDAVLRDSVLTLNPSTAAFFGGKVELRGKLNGKVEIPTLKAVAAWRDGDFGALSRTLSGEDLLAARGTTTLDLVSYAAGAAESRRWSVCVDQPRWAHQIALLEINCARSRNRV